jgi:predicted nuclease of restriction endonuclease-like (RecB) superfamily
MEPNSPAIADYATFLKTIKGRIAAARTGAARTVNHELIRLYWDIGRGIVEKQEALGWGESVVEMLARDLKKAFPNSGGFSANNLWLIRQFFIEYSKSNSIIREFGNVANRPILEQPVQELSSPEKAASPERHTDTTLPELLASVPWGHHIELIKKVKDAMARLYYLQATARFGWSRNVLLNQIKASAYERAVTEKKTHNFPAVLPEFLAEQAEETLVK